jgi:hypothetical protein
MKKIITFFIFALLLYAGITLESIIVDLIITNIPNDEQAIVQLVLWVIIAIFTWIPLLYVSTAISAIIYITFKNKK